MTRTELARLEVPVTVDARPCAAMHGYVWRQSKQDFNAIGATGVTTARRLLGAPT